MPKVKSGPHWAAAENSPALVLVFLLILAGCIGPTVKPGVYDAVGKKGEFQPMPNVPPTPFFTNRADGAREYATKGILEKAAAAVENEYRMGPGDRFAFLVRGRDDISQADVLVSPDGSVSLPRVGIVSIKGLTVKEVTETFSKSLSVYYEKPEVTVLIKEYNNNRVFVLGRVANPGAVSFQGRGTLLEALALAGGVPADDAKTFLSRCMIVRGNELVMWINLKDLLERGNMSLNTRLQNNDVIFIPQSDDEVAFVLGEVKTPGVVPLRSNLTVMDALMLQGGPLKTGNLREIFLIRQKDGKGLVEKIDFEEMRSKGDMRRNFLLREGDLIYVPDTTLTRFNFYATQLLPAFSVIGVTANMLSTFGLLNSLSGLIGGSSD